ncbi:SprT-like domain-containing protein [Cruoricaptor ignavus]|uniref:SprT-like domain-containing protein n=1 Tax=Cruoricaptor ignavus TaxID=1118202 RepID=UPI00370D5223
MPIGKLPDFLPENALPYLKGWCGSFSLHIRITKERQSKLGDYRKLKDGSHKITINSTLPRPLFFLVLTHEIAHLIAFEKFGRNILPHGKEWKHTFREMLVESLAVYPEDLRPEILKFAKSPKANFLASHGIARYFHNSDGNLVTVEELSAGERFSYKGRDYEVLARRKINYLCREARTGKQYLFKPLATVQKL